MIVLETARKRGPKRNSGMNNKCSRLNQIHRDLASAVKLPAVEGDSDYFGLIDIAFLTDFTPSTPRATWTA
jgi:hypothetical protein